MLPLVSGRGLGWKPDRYSPNDRDAAPRLRAASPPPPAWSNDRLIVDVLDQGPVGSCVANAWMQAVRGSHVAQGVANPRLGSRLFTYYNARAYSGEQHVDEGTYLRDAARALNRFGFCPETSWPYGTAVVNTMPTWEAYRAGADQRQPTVYAKIPSVGRARLDDIKRALAAGHLVVFGTAVSEAFCRNELGTGPIPAPTGIPIAGGHALCCAGYDGDTFNVVNSWGTGWGNQGWFEMSGEWMMWDQTNDIWIVEQSPRYSE